MARYTLTLALPAGLAKATAADLSSALGQALLQLVAEVVKISCWQLVADDVSNAEEPIRMIFCWSKPANAEKAVEVGVELISRELMGSGAPRTQGAIDRLLKSLSEQIPGLRVLSDSRSPVAKLAASSECPASSPLADSRQPSWPVGELDGPQVVAGDNLGAAT